MGHFEPHIPLVGRGLGQRPGAAQGSLCSRGLAEGHVSARGSTAQVFAAATRSRSDSAPLRTGDD